MVLPLASVVRERRVRVPHAVRMQTVLVTAKCCVAGTAVEVINANTHQIVNEA